ncbi:MAG: FkbM family methyltransferase [Saprospiraceae bacterium]|jgi:FkbM family methyltransferase
MAINPQERNAAIIEADFDLITANQHTFINALDQNSTVVDLGGNRGEFSKVILNLFSCKKVIVVEGNPQLSSIIKNNLSSHAEQAELIPSLIGPIFSKNVDFHITENPEASSVDKSLHASQNIIKTVRVKMITLDYIYQRIDNDRIDLLKVDIEGMEWEVLKNMTNDDYERIDQITVEFHDFLDSSLVYKTEEVIEHLKGLGYKLIKGKYESRTQYYDTLFCKPNLYAKHLLWKDSMKNVDNSTLRVKNQDLKHILVQKVENLVLQQQHHQKEIETIYNSLSWKLTTPLRKIASLLWHKKRLH